MAVPKKRRSKSKKRLKKQCWKRKAEAKTTKLSSAFTTITQKTSMRNGSNISKANPNVST